MFHWISKYFWIKGTCHSRTSRVRRKWFENGWNWKFKY